MMLCINYICIYIFPKQQEEPRLFHLTVGTEVSAKYRGAFCEAQIKSIKRNVTYKVR